MRPARVLNIIVRPPTVVAPTSGFNRPAVALLGLLGAIQVADPLVSSLSLVKASDELNFTASTQSLAAGISTLALTATAIPGGLLADKFGRRGVLFFSIFLAMAGELITAASPDATVYLLGRVIAGIALGMTFGAAYGMLHNVSSAASLGPAMATFNILNGVVPVIALVAGGVLLGIDWRLTYLILPVAGLLTVFFIPVLLPRVPRIPEVKINVGALGLLALGVAGVLYGLSNAVSGIANPSVFVPLLVGIAAFVGFGLLNGRSLFPVFPVKLFTHPAFLGAVLMGVFWNFASAGLSQLLPNLWQYVTHIPVGLLGLATLPSSAAGIIGSVAAGVALGKGSKARTTAVIGYGLMVVGFLSFQLVGASAVYLMFLPGMVLAGIGWMMNATTEGSLFITLAPAKFFGPVTSSKLTVGQFGYALGLTGTTVLVSLFTLADVSRLTHGAVSGDSAWDDITSYLATGTTSNTDLEAAGREAIATAYEHAFASTTLIMVAVIAAAGALMYVLLRSRRAEIPVDEYLAESLAE
jgi:MFS family permease